MKIQSMLYQMLMALIKAADTVLLSIGQYTLQLLEYLTKLSHWAIPRIIKGVRETRDALVLMHGWLANLLWYRGRAGLVTFDDVSQPHDGVLFLRQTTFDSEVDKVGWTCQNRYLMTRPPSRRLILDIQTQAMEEDLKPVWVGIGEDLYSAWSNNRMPMGRPVSELRILPALRIYE